MNPVHIPKTHNTPEIVLNPERGTLKIAGKSTPGNPYEFYKPIRDFLKKYKQFNTGIVFHIHLNVFNSGSSRCILGLLFEASKYEGEFKKASVNWYFDQGDEEVKRTGEDFKEISKLEFAFYPVKQDKPGLLDLDPF